ncbi:hypothetical protein BRAO375_1030003 [Bradyrhizobium sp. ORS 375]|nr:hypothetical protein BRAO375_1030003 [Bradyrhizobium sp. ORS 375]
MTSVRGSTHQDVARLGAAKLETLHPCIALVLISPVRRFFSPPSSQVPHFQVGNIMWSRGNALGGTSALGRISS